jgi:hypothetical protein
MLKAAQLSQTTFHLSGESFSSAFLVVSLEQGRVQKSEPR